MKLYKLTDQDGYTQRGMKNETLWGAGVKHKATGKGRAICSDQVIHAYEHPLIAVFMNPIHAGITSPLLWECRGRICAREWQLKCGVKSLTTLKKIPIPEITTAQRVHIAILIALTRYSELSFVLWAKNYLDGADTSEKAAREASAKAAEAMPAMAAMAAAEASAAETETWASAKMASMAEVGSWTAVAAKAGGDFDLLSIIKSVTEKRINC